MPINEQNTQLEEEIANIEKDLASKREALKQKHEQGEIPGLPHEKEILREVVGERMGRSGSIQAPASDDQLPTTNYQIPTTSGDPLSYLSDELRGAVQELVNVAFDKSIDEAIRQVKSLGNSALEDAFHDILVDELYAHLVERGKLQKL